MGANDSLVSFGQMTGYPEVMMDPIYGTMENPSGF
jgi:carbamoylphosphate synthase small subunit